MTDRRKSRGFTLLEVLVVLAILLIGLSALFDLQQSALRQSVDVEEKTSVQITCQNEMDRILAGEIPVINGQTGPIPDFDGWSMTFFLDPAPLPNLVRVRITARKFEESRLPDPSRPGTFQILKTEIPGEVVTIAQWARSGSIRVAGGRNGIDAGTEDFLSTGTSRPIAPSVEEGGMIGSLSGPGVMSSNETGDASGGIGTLNPFTEVDSMGNSDQFGPASDPFAAAGFDSTPLATEPTGNVVETKTGGRSADVSIEEIFPTTEGGTP